MESLVNHAGGSRRFTLASLAGNARRTRWYLRGDSYQPNRRQLGHADIGTTANVYAHWTEAMAARTAERMSEILGA